MGFEAVGIVTEHLAQCLDFYRRLGLPLERGGDHDHYQATTQAGFRLMVDSVELIRAFEPGFTKAHGNGVTLCFDQGTAARVDGLYAELTSAGFKSIKAPWDAFWGQRYACVSDPDGNQIDLFAAL